ncbi:hypothetical protein Zmor_018308 [Zophobas morio]|uniref:Gustatory receptor n=1 Tax=Zophobas morio TaxID=2755281 RepID=A0AA38IDN1_9CUCU|nr:hypothetical protein Zmor_018308 [Zophobas morio]
MCATFWNQNQWFKLTQNLQHLKIEKTKSYHKRFHLLQAAYWILNIYAIYVWSDIQGVAGFFEQYFFDLVLFYYQFFYMCVSVVVTQLLKQKYESICQMLKNQKLKIRVLKTEDEAEKCVQKLEEYVKLLKETVNIFNQIFGWPVLLNVFNSSFVTLDYLDDLCKNSFEYTRAQYIGVIISNIITFAFCLVSFCFISVIICF